MKSKYRSFEELLDEYLENPEFAMSFLNQALADEDLAAFNLSLNDIIRARGKVSALAKKARLSRGTLYKVMTGKGKTEIETILKLLHALGYDLTITKKKIESKKLGRVSSKIALQPCYKKKKKS